jgi:hypothetical protein
MFQVYLKLGFEHIADFKAYDHILFLVALCAVYRYSEWKRILILVTAFTIGHSITLALSSLDIIRFNEKLIEILIPATILVTALKNLIWKQNKERLWNIAYLLPLAFGLIHGMGFSSFFKSLLGHEANITLPLFAFNLGVEIGQLCIVIVFMLFNFLFVGIFKIKMPYWTIVISILAAILSLIMIYQRS